MNRPARQPALRAALAGVALLGGFVVGWMLWNRAGDPSGEHPPGPLATPKPPSAATTTASTEQFPDFQPRPLPVGRVSPHHEWTLGDGLDPATIRKLAHSDAEAQRMLEENPTLHQRQLVYRKEPIGALVQRAIKDLEPIREFVLPGVDGREFRVEVVDVDISEGGRRGTFLGHLVGQPESTVTVAFKDRREAFTVVSRSDEVFLTAEPREPGEVIVKRFDPLTYGTGQPCTVD